MPPTAPRTPDRPAVGWPRRDPCGPRRRDRVRRPVRTPREVEQYVDVLDLGLILVSAVLLLVMQVVMHRAAAAPAPGPSAYDDRTDQWYEHDVHRPGYAGQTHASRRSATTTAAEPFGAGMLR